MLNGIIELQNYTITVRDRSYKKLKEVEVTVTDRERCLDLEVYSTDMTDFKLALAITLIQDITLPSWEDYIAAKRAIGKIQWMPEYSYSTLRSDNN